MFSALCFLSVCAYLRRGKRSVLRAAASDRRGEEVLLVLHRSGRLSRHVDRSSVKYNVRDVVTVEVWSGC